jgi:hypothetical protein
VEVPPPFFPEHTERASSPPSPAALAYLRGRDADGRMQSLIAERAALRPVLGLLALRLVKRRAYETLAFRCLGDYARERLGVTAQALREWSRVWEALAELPQLRAAVLSSEISWSVARRAVAHASPETDEAFAATLHGRTVCATEALLHAAFPDAPEPETDPAERVRVSVPLPAAQQGRWLAALELARRTAGEALPVLECAELMAAEALGAIPPGLVARAAGAGESELHAAARGARNGLRTMEKPSREHGLRHQAFGLLRWDRRHAGSEADLMRLAAWAETASPHALDGALRRAMKRLQRIDHDLGRILRQVLERRLYRELGFISFERYVEERIDISPRTARRWVQMARLGPTGSAVANAFRDGLLTPKQASLVSEVVPPTQQPDAIAFAQGVTLRRLEDELGARDTARDTITFTAPPEAANVFLLALEAARLHLEAEKQTKQSTTEALLWMLDHVIAAWIEQGAQFKDYADFNRDQFRCTAPGCTARRSLQSHHLVFKSAGGPDEAWNRTTLCAFHHQRGIHAHTMRCSGRAPQGLIFELGLRAAGPPLLRARAGDVLLSA